MNNQWLDALKREAKQHNTQHNTVAALREAPTEDLRVGPGRIGKISDTRQHRTDKTDETPRNNHKISTSAEIQTDKTDKTTEAARLGLVATWSGEFGYVSLHDPTTGEWHDLNTPRMLPAGRWEKRTGARDFTRPVTARPTV